jgi:predicted nucleic acid-binding protein
LILPDLSSGASVFIDANILTYHFQPHPLLGQACSDFLQRIENQDLVGYTSTHVVAETSHRLMTIEACTKFGWPFAGIANPLRRHSSQIQQLTTFRQDIDNILKGRVQLIAITAPLLSSAAALSQQLNLLTNDALIVAARQANGLTNLASHDADFDRVPGLTRYDPG